jgi:general secretion pathway protein J
MQSSPHRYRSRGFTLMEVMIAVVIFSIVSILAMSGYNQLVDQTEHTRVNMQRIRSMQKAVLRITQDFAELEPRPIRNALSGAIEPCLLADGRGQYIAQLTRSGWSNPAGIQRPTLQRVGYRLDKDKLVRDYWPVLDRVQTVDPISVVLIDHVSSLKLRMMDAQQTWQDYWPTDSNSPNSSTQNGSSTGSNNAGDNIANAMMLEQRPIAVEVTLELEDWGKIIRIVEVPG